MLPEVPIVGGMVSDCAWGPTRSLRGALFHGEATLDSGAVGCLLSGPLQVCFLVTTDTCPLLYCRFHIAHALLLRVFVHDSETSRL